MLGPVVALAVPAGVLVLALFVRWVPCDGVCFGPMAFSWLLVLWAVPTALVVGIPWLDGGLVYGLAVTTSLLWWLVAGRWAAGRATAADVDAGWGGYARELAVLSGAVWAGVLAGLAGPVLWSMR